VNIFSVHWAFWVVLAELLTGPPGLLWRGNPVHPGCIRELNTDLADSRPVIAAVDLEGCARSNRFASPPEVDGPVLRARDSGEGARGYFQYEYLGVLSTGVHVVRIVESGGGSGAFQGLLFLRIDTATVLEDGKVRAREMLVLRGSESLGDRDKAEVTLSGDSVTIRRREFRGALGYGPEQVVIRRIR
jgi:hypothetical protein